MLTSVDLHLEHGLGVARVDVSATYDLHEYEDEKREALEKWAQRIKSIVSPVPAAPAKVVKLRGRRR